MRMSVQTGGILPRFGVEEGLRLIAEAGFDGVDLNLNHFLPADQIRRFECRGFFDQTDEEILRALRPVKEAARARGLRILQAHAPFPTCVNDTKMNEYVLAACIKCIMMCDDLDCRNLVVHPGFLPTDEQMTPQQEWDFNMRLFGALIPHLKRHRVVCCLENMFSAHRGKITEAICADAGEAARYIDALNEMAGERCFAFCLDTGHAMVLGKDLYSMVHQLGDRLQVLHVHDNHGIVDDHQFPYMGIIDWDKFCRALREVRYAGDLNFETFRTMDCFDPALAPPLLALLHATGELFAGRIESPVL